MMTDKHQALRDALRECSFYKGCVSYPTALWERAAGPISVRALLADHDRMRDALEGLLNALPSATTHPAIKAARKALQECEQ